MQGSAAQMLALTVTGNAFLEGFDIGPFWPEADAFVFCDSVRFAAADGMIAADPEDWLRQLRRDSARLRLGVVTRDERGFSDRQTAGFANGGPRWMVEAARPGLGSTWWEPEWEVTGDPSSSAPDRRIWSVTYWCRTVPFTPPPARPFPAITAELGDTLDALASLVERAAPDEAMPGWAETFRRARHVLDHDRGEPERGDPGPAGYLRPEALHMIHACRAAWVFGGMGAWNDGAYWGSIEAEGDRLSEALFTLLQQGIVAAANSTGPAAQDKDRSCR